MPCMSGPYYGESETYESEWRQSSRAACDLARVIRQFPQSWVAVKRKLEPETLKWIEQHDKEDREREAAEMEQIRQSRLRSKALGKLSKEERKALGI